MIVAGVVSVDRLVRVDFELAKGPLSCIKHALEVIREKLMRWCSDVLAAYAQPAGVVVHFGSKADRGACLKDVREVPKPDMRPGGRSARFRS